MQAKWSAQGHNRRSTRLNVQAGVEFNLVGVLIFSAIPFVSVQALADSDLGKKLQVRLWAKLGYCCLQSGLFQGLVVMPTTLACPCMTVTILCSWQRDLESRKKGYKAEEKRRERELGRARQQRHARFARCALGALDDAPDDASNLIVSCPNGWIDVMHLFIHPSIARYVNLSML